MFKWYADSYKLKETSVTSHALNRVRAMVLVSIPAFAFAVYTRLFGWPEGMSNGAGLVVFWVCIALVIAPLLSRIVNRFYARDRYLDEWEVRIKHQSMAFGFQFLFYTAAVIFLVYVGMDIISPRPAFDVTGLEIVFGAFCFMLIGFYAQVLSCLSLIQPIDAEGVVPA